jgi:hypothetical protein
VGGAGQAAVEFCIKVATNYLTLPQIMVSIVSMNK